MNIVRRSLYMQVREGILKLIHDDYSFMKKLPTEKDLSEIIGVSRNTIREAIKSLENEGFVTTRHGVGTFVIQDSKNIKYNLSTFDSSTKILTDHNYRPETIGVSFDLRKAPLYIQKQLQTENSEIFYIERVRTADGIPVIYIEDYLPPLPDIKRRYTEFKGESLVEFLSSYGQQIVFVNCKIQAIMSDEKIQNKLSLGKCQALLLLQQTHFSSKGLPILYSDSYYLSDKFDFSIVRNTL